MAIEFAMLHDVEKCIACRGCQVACKQWKNLPAEKTSFDGEYQSRKDLTSKTYVIVKMKEVLENDKVRWDFLKYQCMHCGSGNCITGCPMQAVIKDEKGIITIQEDLCVGCGLCEINCAYNVPHVDRSSKKARKCDLCIDRVEKYIESGFNKTYLPACAKTCMTDAVLFGTREEMVLKARERLAELKEKYPDACTYNVETSNGGSGAAMMYVLPYKPSVYGLPDEIS